jgi:hypothetical protein
LGEALNVGVVFSFDHDASELFRAGIAEDDAAIFAESGLGFGEGAGDFGERFERGFGFHFDVDDDLRVVLEALDERFDFAAHGNERSDFDGGEKAVASGAIFEKNDVARLFAAEDVAAAEHFLENIAIADGSASEGDSFAGENALETEIGHGSGDDAIALELVLRFEMTGDGEENAIAVDDFSGFANEKSAVGIAIEGDAKTGAFCDDALLQALEMERTAAVVDVAAVWGDTHGDDVGAESAEEFGAELVGGAIGAVENDAEAGEASSWEDATAEKIEIFGVERGVGRGDGWIFGRRIGTMLEDVRFELLFDGIGKLHAGVGEKLYAVVLIRIVGSGNDDAGLKIILADETSDAGSGNDAGKSDRGAGFGESSGEEGGDVRAGFASVHADENMSRGMFAEKIGGERAADGEKSGVIEGRSARDAANAIGSEKFFGHEGLTFKS